MRCLPLSIALFLAPLAAMPATAQERLGQERLGQERHGTEPAPPPGMPGIHGAVSPAVAGTGHGDRDCYCIARGHMFPEGERVCLNTAQGPRLAQCRMETNVMSWTFSETPCPES